MERNEDQNGRSQSRAVRFLYSLTCLDSFVPLFLLFVTHCSLDQSVRALFEALESVFISTNNSQGRVESWMDRIEEKYHRFAGEQYEFVKQTEPPFFSVKLQPPGMTTMVSTYLC